MWSIFKVFTEFVTILLLFMFWFFDYKVCRILAPRPGMDPTPTALEANVLTTGLPGKSLIFIQFLKVTFHLQLF